jgi:hypothetical protein
VGEYRALNSDGVKLDVPLQAEATGVADRCKELDRTIVLESEPCMNTAGMASLDTSTLWDRKAQALNFVHS